MTRPWWLLACVLLAVGVQAWPERIKSDDGRRFYLFNPDSRTYICDVTLSSGLKLPVILRPGARSEWYFIGEHGADIECSAVRRT